MVEQNAFAALELSDRSYVLEQGRMTLTGTGARAARGPEGEGRVFRGVRVRAGRPAVRLGSGASPPRSWRQILGCGRLPFSESAPRSAHSIGAKIRPRHADRKPSYRSRQAAALELSRDLRELRTIMLTCLVPLAAQSGQRPMQFDGLIGLASRRMSKHASSLVQSERLRSASGAPTMRPSSVSAFSVGKSAPRSHVLHRVHHRDGKRHLSGSQRSRSWRQKMPRLLEWRASSYYRAILRA